MANISLEQASSEDQFNFQSIYEMEDDSGFEDNDSPFNNFVSDCSYSDPAQFHKAVTGFQCNTSYFHLNCRSLSSNWDSFQNLLCEMHGDNFKFDIIGISEIFDCSRDDRLHLPGYHDLITRTRQDSIRGGVGLFISNHITYSIREDLSVFIPHIYESLFIEFKGAKNMNNQIVGVIYRPNTQPQADLDIFSNTLYNVMDLVNAEHKSCILLGDFNVDLLQYNSHVKTNEFIDGVFCKGFIPLVLKPTRMTRTSATLIDHIYSNFPNNNSKTGIIITDVSDHFGIYHITGNKSIQLPNKKVGKRIFSDYNLNTFNHLLDQCDFDTVMSNDNPDSAYNQFIDIYNIAFNKAFPMKIFKPNKKYIKREPWVTKGLLTSIRTKSKLLKLKLCHPSDHNIDKYKTFSYQFNKLKRYIKTDYYKTLIESNKHDIKKTWKILKEVIGKHNNTSSLPQNFIVNNETVSDQNKIADSFNDFFSSIGQITSQNVPLSTKHYSSYLDDPTIHSMFLSPVDSDEIINIVKKFKPKTSSGHDNISTKLMKHSLTKILTPLIHIINKSFETGIVPIQLKKAKVIPIYKQSDPKLLSNYRPISLLPAFSKIFEKAIFNRMINYLNSNNLLYKHQYGFRPKHATIHAIMQLLNSCAKSSNIHPKQYTLSIFCDLSKAFDVINHNILFHKLDNLGFRGIINNWLQSYLSQRSQYVEINSVKSHICPIECGVPQGSILGPLLYLIYVNDIANSTSGNILSFADDTSLYISDSNLKHLFTKSNTEMHKLYEWFCANRLSLNPSKTKFIVIKTPQQSCDFTDLTILINNTPLSQIGSQSKEKFTKFLGLYIDEHLSWNYHVNHINKKISRSLFALKQVKHFLPPESLHTLYFATIHPHILYGILAWGNANKTITNKVNLLQKRAIRIISKAKYNSHTEPLLKNLNILNVNDLYEFEILIFMHKFIHHKLPKSFSNIFTFNHEIRGDRPTRQSSLLHQERCDSNFAKRLPLYKFPVIWNIWSRIVPGNIVSLPQFKKFVKNHMISNYSNSIKCNNIHCQDCIDKNSK